MKQSKMPLYAPSHWPSWLVLGLMWLIATLLSYGMAQRLGRLIGGAAYRLAKRRRHIARVNLKLCFPDYSDKEIDDLNRRHFEAMGIGLVMTAFGWWASDRKLEPLCHFAGLHHLEKAFAEGKGVLMVGHHFTDMEIVGSMAARRHPIAVVYRQHENPVLEWALARQRRRLFADAISHKDVRKMVRTLKNNIGLWYPPDQAYSGQHSAVVPFFGVPAATHTGTSTLARLSKAPVIMVYGHRLPGNAGYRVEASAPLGNFPTDDAAADAARINLEIETIIRKAPEQYFWSHRRFKRRRGLADPY